MRCYENFSIPYPFPVTHLPDDEATRLRAYTDLWAQKYQLFPKDPMSYSDTIWTFIKYCTFPDMSAQQLEPVVMYLMIFFYLDDYKSLTGGAAYRETYPEVLNRLIAILEGELVKPDDKSIYHAMTEFRDRLLHDAKKKRETIDDFRQRWKQYIEALIWEADKLKYGDVNVTTYKEHRLYVFGSLPYFEIFKLALNCHFLKWGDPYYEEVHQLEILAAELNYIENDVSSIGRDIENKDMNLVLLTQKEEKISQDQALERIIKLRSEKVTKFVEMRDLLPFDLLEDHIIRYIHYLESEIVGNYVAACELKYRYYDSK